MKTRNIILALMLAAFSALAVAGYTQPAPVTVNVNDDGSGDAQGDMVTARFSDSEFTSIGCGYRFFDTGGGSYIEYGFCQARDENDVYVFCSTFNPDLLEAMRFENDYSFITFSWNSDGECNRIGFSTQSLYIPEHTDKKDKNK